MAEVNISLFGSLRVRVGSEDIGPRGKKARAMLAILATSPAQTASRERLADLLWSDRGEEQARGSLRQALAEIRATRLVSVGAIAISRESVVLDEGVRTDVSALMDACAKKDMPRLAKLVGAIPGALLSDLDGLSPQLDQWLRIERAGRHESIVAAVLAEATIMVSEGNFTDLPAILRGLDVLEPANEVVARLGMQADHAAGDLASLHRRYRQLTDNLKREFDARPSEETRALFYRLTAVAISKEASSVTPEDGPPWPSHPRTPPIVIVSQISWAGGGEAAKDIAADASEEIRIALLRYSDVRVMMLDGLDLEHVEHVCGNALAAYMLSGRLRETNGEMKAVLQLGNVFSRIVVWSEQIPINSLGLTAAAEQIVARAVGAVIPAIDRDLGSSWNQQQSRRDDAVALYSRARHLVRSVRTIDAVRSGMKLLEQTIGLDPAHIGARLLLAQLYNTDLWQQVTGHDVQRYRGKAFALIQEAAAIEPENPRIQMKLAWCYLRRQEWSNCERRLATALGNSPYDADAVNEAALAMVQLGDLDQAGKLMQKSFALNPFPPPDYHADYALLCGMRGDAAGAEEHFEASGETRLQYIAIRLANLTEVSGGEQRRQTLALEFRTRFGSGWSANRRPNNTDIMDWLDQTYVFRRPEHRDFWRTRFSAGLA